MITPALAALLALGLQEVGLHFAPEEGLALSKTVLVRHELGLIEMGSTREGSPLLREDVGGWLVAGTRQAWVDEYLRVAGGRPEVFRRTLTRFVPFDTFSFLGPKCRGWHDRWSGTRVVRDLAGDKEPRPRRRRRRKRRSSEI